MAEAPALVVVRPPLCTAPSGGRPQGLWLWSVVALSLVGFAAAIALSPGAASSPTQSLSWLLFLGSSVHVASTGWLFSFAEVRRHAGQHRRRYVLAPIALAAAAAAAAVLLPPRQLAVPLLAYFCWQFFHYQKQNLGVAALAASSARVPALTSLERRIIMVSGWLGIAALVLRPGLLQLPLRPRSGWYPSLPSAIAAGGFALMTVVAGGLLVARARADRPAGFAAAYLLAVLFPLPIFIFSSPYAAVGGMTIAHGLQYLVLVAMVAAGPSDRRASSSRLTVFIGVTVVAGLGLNLASHLHTGGAIARVGYGAYLGVVMTHFVVDADLWRLRTPFARQFLTARIPLVVDRSS